MIFVSVVLIIVVIPVFVLAVIIGTKDSPILGLRHCTCHIWSQVVVSWWSSRGWELELMGGWDRIGGVWNNREAEEEKEE